MFGFGELTGGVKVVGELVKVRYSAFELRSDVLLIWVFYIGSREIRTADIRCAGDQIKRRGGKEGSKS
jgi:hypothetical protein